MDRQANSPLQELLNQAFFTPIELAAILRLNKLTVYRKLKSGELPGRLVDGSWKTSRAELLKYLEEKYGPVNPA